MNAKIGVDSELTSWLILRPGMVMGVIVFIGGVKFTYQIMA